MARHDQRPVKSAMVCIECQNDNCFGCVDRLRAFYTNEIICTCGRADHADKRDGEARYMQSMDPFTGDIHAPGLVVLAEGGIHVKLNDEDMTKIDDAVDDAIGQVLETGSAILVVNDTLIEVNADVRGESDTGDPER